MTTPSTQASPSPAVPRSIPRIIYSDKGKSKLTTSPNKFLHPTSRAGSDDSTISYSSTNSDFRAWENLLAKTTLSSASTLLAKELLASGKRGSSTRFEVDYTTTRRSESYLSLTPSRNSNASTSSSLLSIDASIPRLARIPSPSIPHISRAPSAFLYPHTPIVEEPSTTTDASPTTPSARKRPLKILSLDGGGIRGLSTLLILRHLKTHLTSLGYPSTKPPCEIFDLICGTSTGGLIALMLGRMGMTIDNCIEVYKQLAKKIFKSMLPERAARFVGTDARLDSEILERMVRAVVEKRLGDGEAEMECENGSYAKTFVVAVLYSAMNKAKPVLFRTYHTPTHPASPCPIWQAARATSAAPTWFSPQSINNVLYIDGGVGHNNPTLLALKEIKNLYPGGDQEIGMILSLGTGTKFDISAKNPMKACIGYTTGSVGIHHQMEDRFGRCYRSEGGDQVYFRFDVPEIGSTVSLGDWDRIKFLEGETRKYLDTEEVKIEMGRCAKKFMSLDGL